MSEGSSGAALSRRAGEPGCAPAAAVQLGCDAADSAIRDRAVLAAGLSFTISDPHQPDNPLVFVNPAFERTTGYCAAEALGRNCRFLQGPDTDPAAVARVRELLARGEHGSVTLLNHRKDGTPFWNELSLSPVYDDAGRLTHVVGIQSCSRRCRRFRGWTSRAPTCRARRRRRSAATGTTCSGCRTGRSVWPSATSWAMT